MFSAYTKNENQQKNIYSLEANIAGFSNLRKLGFQMENNMFRRIISFLKTLAEYFADI